MSYKQETPESIQQLFASIAPTYDRGNATLSFQLHRWWNKKLARSVHNKATEGTYLDLCSGTGDIAFALSRLGALPQKTILLDFSPEMLTYAKKKCPPSLYNRIQYIEADAQKIPLEDSSVDAITIAYGIRNVASPQKCFEEVFRVLKPGGVLSILELTRPNNFFVRGLHSIYLKVLLPQLGRFLSSNKSAYSYLSKTIQSFTSPVELSATLKTLNFSEPTICPLTFGIATLITAKKSK